MGNPHLPGARRPSRIQPDALRRDPDDRTAAESWTSDRLQRAILKHLRAGPLAKWQLRDVLGLNEARILTELKALRVAGKVTLSGTGSRNWVWGLKPKAVVLAPESPEEPASRVRSVRERYADLFDDD